jgi:hypothetical protein
MSEKSHVSVEQQVCLVCGCRFDTGAILLDRRLRPSMERHTITGWDLCPKHRELYEQGYVALVECDPEQSGSSVACDRIPPNEAYRTGKLAHLRKDVFVKLFNVPGELSTPCVFVDPEVMTMLEKMQPPSG